MADFAPDKLAYDKADRYSIEAYALKLKDKSLRQVRPDVNYTEHRANKGSFGQLTEEIYFNYKPNNNALPDFPEAGVELKTSPIKHNKKRFAAKERLVLNTINYLDEYDRAFEDSSFWTKNRIEELTVGRITFAPNTAEKDLVAEQYKAIGQVNIPHNLAPSPREQKLVESARAVIARWESTDWKAAPTADYMNALRNVLEAYDAPGSQGGEKAPIGEEEAVEIMMACTQDHVARGGKAGKACMQLIYRALAKRLGWM